MTEIYLIRHGEAEGNVFRRIHGQHEALLTPRGFQQAKYVEKRFQNIHIDACFASDLTRASLTARSIYIPKHLKLQRDSRFREINLGPWEDLPFGYLDQFDAERMQCFNRDPAHWYVAGAETYEEYTGRFIAGMKEAAARYDGGTVAIFAHGAVTRGTLMHLFFDDDGDRLPFADNTSVSHLYCENGTFTYDYVNDNSHVPEALSTYAAQGWWRKTGDRSIVNFYYVPYRQDTVLPEGLSVPELSDRGTALTAILQGKPAAIVSMGPPEGDCGRILGMTVREGFEGRYYGDQLLGAAVSHFRHLGCKWLALTPGYYPDQLISRYGFGDDLIRSIDTQAFDWDDPAAAL